MIKPCCNQAINKIFPVVIGKNYYNEIAYLKDSQGWSEKDMNGWRITYCPFCGTKIEKEEKSAFINQGRFRIIDKTYDNIGRTILKLETIDGEHRFDIPSELVEESWQK